MIMELLLEILKGFPTKLFFEKFREKLQEIFGGSVIKTFVNTCFDNVNMPPVLFSLVYS